MPSYSKPSSSSLPPSNDLLKIGGLTLIPFGCLGAAWFIGTSLNAKEQCEYYAKLDKPCWAITDTNTMIGLDVATLTPLGYALYLVTRDGTTGEEVKKALTAFGGTMGLYLLSTLAASKNRDLRCWAGAGAAVGAAAGFTSYLFGKIDKTAGYLMMPFAAWAFYYAVQTMAMNCKEQQKRKQI